MAPLYPARITAFADFRQYRVITAHETQRMRWYAGRPAFPASSATPSVPQGNAARPAGSVPVAVENVARKGPSKAKKSPSHTKKRRGSSKGKQTEEGHEPLLRGGSRGHSGSPKSDRSQRVDLIVEDTAAEEREREEIRREGSASRNEPEHKHFVFVPCCDKTIVPMLMASIAGCTVKTSAPKTQQTRIKTSSA